jgi:hypothetical protein
VFQYVSDARRRLSNGALAREVLQPFIERVIAWVVENYDPPQCALGPAAYKEWRDTIYPSGEATTISNI